MNPHLSTTTNVPILSTGNTPAGSIILPLQFNEPIRQDLIQRAVHAISSSRRQPYGSSPRAGKRSSAKLSRRRRDYKGAYGMGISRVPRKTLSRQGTRMNYVGAFAPGTVKGRQAHPPKATKNWKQYINTKENRKAIRSALAATCDATLVRQRGHTPPPSYPFIIEQSIESFTKTKDLLATLTSLGFTAELERSSNSKIRAGKATMRGRRVSTPRGILLVTAGPCPVLKPAHNIPGIDAVPVNALNATLLAPGGVPGRLTIYTTGAIQRLEQEHLFT